MVKKNQQQNTIIIIVALIVGVILFNQFGFPLATVSIDSGTSASGCPPIRVRCTVAGAHRSQAGPGAA